MIIDLKWRTKTGLLYKCTGMLIGRERRVQGEGKREEGGEGYGLCNGEGGKGEERGRDYGLCEGPD